MGATPDTYLFLLFWGVRLQTLAAQESLGPVWALEVQGRVLLTPHFPSYCPPPAEPASGQRWMSWWNLQKEDNVSVCISIYSETSRGHHRLVHHKASHSNIYYPHTHAERRNNPASTLRNVITAHHQHSHPLCDSRKWRPFLGIGRLFSTIIGNLHLLVRKSN